MNCIRILIFEDNETLRKSLEELISLSDNYVVVSSYGNAEDALEKIKLHMPQLVLMDIDMPGTNGIEAVKQIRTENKAVPILMLTVFEDNLHILDAICAGASGYVLKKNIPEKLMTSIKDVLTDGATLSPSVAKMIIANMQQASDKPAYDFTGREQEVLSLLCKGFSYKMIAAELFLSFKTIRTYIKRIYEKLQVHSSTEAVSKAINERLI